ncbi:MAG TPA: acyl-CoA dehydrogenase family protein [Gemmatimonadota bacterium]|nr:acyl-CoA dehydrogenase family protein [Gemmatimonadota bacterium]
MSVCRPFFTGHIDPDALWPYPEMTPDESESLELLRESLRRFGRERVDSRAIDEEARIPPEVLEGLAELGIFGIIVPEEYDGFGASSTFYAKAFEALATIDGAIVVTVGAHESIGLKGILQFGTEEQKRRFLPPLARGEQIAAFALTEPTSGSDAASIRTRATWSEERGAWILDGTKIWITNGGIAEVFTVFAQTAVERGGETVDRITAFIVPRSLPGVTSGPEERKLGIRGSSTTEVHFEDVVVPPDLVLGEVGGGFKVAMEVLNSGRLGLAAGCVGGMKLLLSEATRNALEREQFGRSISEFELIRKKLAGMALEIYGIESMVYLTTGMVDRGSEDYSLESAICKVRASEAGWRVVNEALQIAGGMGYMKEYPFERYLRDARINLIFEGTNEILRLYTALSGLEAPGEHLKAVARALKDPIKQLGLLTDYARDRALRAIHKPELPELHPLVAETARALPEWVAEFAGTVEWALRRHGGEIVERQMVLERLADAVGDLFLMAAVVSRADRGCRLEAGVAAEAHATRARLVVNDAWRRVRRNLARVRAYPDNDVRVVAAEVLSSEGADLPGRPPVP